MATRRDPAVWKAEGLKGRNAAPPRAVLQLHFDDDSRLTLGTRANLKRMLEFSGEHTSSWIGQAIEIYYNPVVRGPSGEERKIRIQQPNSVSPLAQPFLHPERHAESPEGRQNQPGLPAV